MFMAAIIQKESEAFCKKGVFKNFAKFTRKHLTLAQVFS